MSDSFQMKIGTTIASNQHPPSCLMFTLSNESLLLFISLALVWLVGCLRVHLSIVVFCQYRNNHLIYSPLDLFTVWFIFWFPVRAKHLFFILFGFHFSQSNLYQFVSSSELFLWSFWAHNSGQCLHFNSIQSASLGLFDDLCSAESVLFIFILFVFLIGFSISYNTSIYNFKFGIFLERKLIPINECLFFVTFWKDMYFLCTNWGLNILSKFVLSVDCMRFIHCLLSTCLSNLLSFFICFLFVCSSFPLQPHGSSSWLSLTSSLPIHLCQFECGLLTSTNDIFIGNCLRRTRQKSRNVSRFAHPWSHVQVRTLKKRNFNFVFNRKVRLLVSI